AGGRVRRPPHRGGIRTGLMRGRGIVAGGLVGLALAGCGAGSQASHRRTVKSAAPVPVTHVEKRASARPDPLVRLQSALSAGLRAAGPGTGAIVYDISARRQLFSL